MYLRFFSFVFVLFYIFPNSPLQAQTYPLGLTPSNLKWRQINNEDMQIVFPEGIEDQAQRIANLVTYLKHNNLESIGEKTGKVTIFLQNQTIVPNGFVALSPFRSELYLTPPQFNFLGTGDWIDLLTTHEYRHVLQTTNAKKGFTGAASFLLGENTLAFLRRLAMPRWYLEGDAVGTETALSNSGRGRLPHFNMEYRALRLAGMNYNYEKASATSFKDYVPNHYNLGYYMTTFARRKFGEDIWQKSLTNSVKYKSFFPLSTTLKKYTGYRTPQMYKATMGALDSMWQLQDEKINVNKSTTISAENVKKYTNYRNPQYLDEDTWIVEKSSFDQIRTYYKLSRTGKEKKLFAPGFNYSFNNTLSVVNNRITWSETTFDVRWGSKDFSIIRTGNIDGSDKTKLSSKSKLFSPSLSPDGSKIVAVQTSEEQKYALVILDAYNGNVLQKLPNPDNIFFSFPRYTSNGENITVVAQHDQKHALVLVNAETGSINFLIDYSYVQLSNPFPKNNKVYYSATYTGINNIFAVDITSKEITQITSSRFGAFQPAVSPSGNKLVYSDYSAMGYSIKEVTLNENNSALSTKSLDNSIIEYYKPLSQQVGGSIENKVDDNVFPTKKYSKISGLINPHSIQAFPYHPNYSIEVQLDNKFQTASGSVGYNYNVNENTGGFYANFTYGQFFPVLETGVRFNNNRSRTSFYSNSIVRNDTLYYTPEPLPFNKEWKEDDYSVGLTLPFNLTHGNYLTSLRLSGAYHLHNLTYTELPDNIFQLSQRNGYVNSMEYRLRFSRSRITALQQINPRYAQIFDVRYRSTFITNRNKGDVFTATANLYFPGFWRTHSLNLGVAYQNEGIDETYQFTDNFSYPRGYSSIPHDAINKYAINYALPLIYPDIALGPLAFFQRIKLNAFFDIAWVNIDSRSFADLPYLLGNGNKTELFFSATGKSYKSFGAELSFDIRFFRLLDGNLGVRYSYLMDVDKTLNPGRNEHQIDFIILSLGG